MKKICAIGCTLALFAGAASADPTNSCANPLTIASNQTLNGNLCEFPNSLPSYGGTGSPTRDAIYRFTAQNANAQISVSGFPEAEVYLMPSPCSSGTDPISLGFVGSPMPVSGLVNGQQYFVIVTADAGDPTNRCGPFTVQVNGILPVELEAFSVE